MRSMRQPCSIVQTLEIASRHGRLQGSSTGWQAYEQQRLCSLGLSRYVSVSSSQVGGLKCMDLDAVEQRYLLTGAADSTLKAFDVLAADDAGGHVPTALQPLFSIKRSHPAAHRYQVTGLVWYPVDTGLFVSGSADQEVKVWDANELQVACSFRCQDKVLALGMSSVATSHALIAVGSKSPGLRLADVVSGAFTHTLAGHEGGAWSVCWSASNEHQLYAGDGTGAVRLWDIRRSGSRALLDMNATPQTAWAAGRAARCGRGRRQRSCSRTSDGGEQGSGSRRGRAKRRQERQVSPQPRRRQRRQQHSEGEEDRPRAGSRVVPLAHEGAVVGVHATADDRSILTAGADHRVRLWDVGSLRHQLVHYADTFSKGQSPKRMSSTPDGRVVFVPRGSDVQVFDVHTGQLLALLSQGHYDVVTACVYAPNTGRLWSAGLDGAVLAWEPHMQHDAKPDASSDHAMDWWLAAAAGHGTRAHMSLAAAGTAAASAAVVAGRSRAARGVLPDVDWWSDDDTFVGGG